jgi:plastocyanin
VMNHRSTPDNAFIQYKVTIDDDPSIKPVHPYWLDVNNCHADPQYTVPGTGGKGSTADNTTDLIMPESGRIVAGGGHVHGGARKLTLNEPGCGNRQVSESLPTWGLPSHPFYNVRPILHEPGPINMTAFTTPTGIPVNAGEQLRLHALYDNSLPHMRVMGIDIIYVAPDPAVTSNCGPLPGDVTTIGTDQPGRSGPIPFAVPLTGLDANGQAVSINAPPGKLRKVKGGTTIEVGDRYFSRPNVKIKRKRSLHWQFDSPALHNVTLASGPEGFASDNLNGGRGFDVRFNRPGTYRLFCSLHPVQMTERVVVQKKHKKKKHKHGKHKKHHS